MILLLIRLLLFDRRFFCDSKNSLFYIQKLYTRLYVEITINANEEKREKKRNPKTHIHCKQLNHCCRSLFFVERFVNMKIEMDLVLCIINNVRQSNDNNSNNNGNNLLFHTNKHSYILQLLYTHTFYTHHTYVCMYSYTKVIQRKISIHDRIGKKMYTRLA